MSESVARKKFVIAGGSGFVGLSLAHHLANHGASVVILSRKMPIGLPASAWMVRMGARYLLRTDPELALYGRYVLPKRLNEEGFRFQLPELRQSLLDLLGREAR